MKALLISLLTVATPIAAYASESYTLLTESNKVTGFLKQKGKHGDVEFVVLSTDTGSAWHTEDLSVYLRNLNKTRKFNKHVSIPFPKNGHQEFKCEYKDNHLFIKSRSNKNDAFMLILTLKIPNS